MNSYELIEVVADFCYSGVSGIGGSDDIERVGFFYDMILMSEPVREG